MSKLPAISRAGHIVLGAFICLSIASCAPHTKRNGRTIDWLIKHPDQIKPEEREGVARYKEEFLPPDPLSHEQEFKLAKHNGIATDVMLEVLKISGGSAAQLKNCSDSPYRPVAGINVPPITDESKFEPLRKSLKKRGYDLFITQQGQVDRCGLMRTTDPFVIVKTMGTSGPNYGVGTDDVIAKLKEWQKTMPLDIVGAADDLLYVRFNRPSGKSAELANEINKFCPDAVSQGTSLESDDGDDSEAAGLRRLTEHIDKNDVVCFWWD